MGNFETALIDLIAEWRKRRTSWDEIATALEMQLDGAQAHVALEEAMSDDPADKAH